MPIPSYTKAASPAIQGAHGVAAAAGHGRQQAARKDRRHHHVYVTSMSLPLSYLMYVYYIIYISPTHTHHTPWPPFLLLVQLVFPACPWEGLYCYWQMEKEGEKLFGRNLIETVSHYPDEKTWLLEDGCVLDSRTLLVEGWTGGGLKAFIVVGWLEEGRRRDWTYSEKAEPLPACLDSW